MDAAATKKRPETARLLNWRHEEPACVEELIVRWQERLERRALRMGTSAEAAEDLAQDILFETLDRADRGDLEPRTTLTRWLYWRARCRALDCIEARRRDAGLLADAPKSAPKSEGPDARGDGAGEPRDPHPGPLTTARTHEAIQQARAALETLPERRRRALWLTKAEEKTAGEAAAEMRAPAATVRSWVREGVHEMRARLEDPLSA